MAKLPDKLTDSQVLDVNFYKDDIEEMYSDKDKIEELADRLDTNIKSIYFDSEARQMVGRGTLTFVSEALDTLTRLRSAKCEALNQIVTTKLKLSQLALNKQKNDDEHLDAAIVAKEFNKLFLQHAKELQPKNTQNKLVERSLSDTNIKDDNILESRLNNLISDGKLKLTDNELAIKYESRGVKYKVINSKSNPHLIACASDTGEELKDYPNTLLPKDSILEGGMVKNNKYICPDNTEYELF